MAQVFVKKKSGQVLGPIESNQLKAMVAAGSLVQNDSLAKTKQGPWKQASQLNGLFDSKESPISNDGATEQKSEKENNKTKISAERVGDLEVTQSSIKIFRHATKSGGNAFAGANYFVNKLEQPLVLSKGSVDSVHAAKGKVIALTDLQKRLFPALSVFAASPILLLFSPCS